MCMWSLFAWPPLYNGEKERVGVDIALRMTPMVGINGEEMPLKVDPALKIPGMGPIGKVNGECSNVISRLGGF